MAGFAQDPLGAAIQSYVHARWGERGDRGTATAVQPLDADLRERLDALGMDGERLLGIPTGQVMEALRSLEQLALLEDDAAAAAAAQQRAGEERDWQAPRHNRSWRQGNRPPGGRH